MKTLVEVQTEGGTVKFDVDDVTGVGPANVSRKDGTVTAQLNESLDKALASARPAAEAVINTFRALSPDAITVEFGLRLDAEAGAVFAKAGIGAHFTVTLNWDRASEQKPVASAPKEHPAPPQSA
jgi:Trypsin-co-occurring domain 1